MATETYKWFVPDPNLRAAYGGAAIQAGGDSAEITPATLVQRYICQQLGLPAGATRFLFEVGTATDTKTYCRVPDLVYSDVSSFLSATELATVVSTLPAGWTKGSVYIQLQPNPRRKTIIVRGDSICAGQATTSGDTRDTWMAQAINLIAGQTLVWEDVGTYRHGITKNYQLLNLSLGSSSFDNSVALGLSEEAYPKRESLAYNQRIKTLPMNSADCALVYGLTNDLPYDLTISAADNWTRASTRLSTVRADFPLLKVAIITNYKRTTNVTLNTRIDAYNALVRANAGALGVTVIDIEANCPKVNMVTGDPTNLADYTDQIHITTLTHAQIAANVGKPYIDSLWAI